ncbi:hypothetical protein P3X46_012784 [Hevea brasiliensis]|uniref:CCHC-type domain-containing protein n=1 Tax=Hevea brasiliensis TaxID=3981 RepID=A0ABQ9MBB7_HEVBR|nr:hypothetical protein P3X46_012784 [Hevea brasiliensis]
MDMEMLEEESEIMIGKEDVDRTDSVPVFKVSQSLQAELAKPWKRAVVVKLLGKKVGYRALCSRLQSLWNSGEMKVLELGNEFFLVLREIGKVIRRVVKVDYLTSDAIRGKFARIAVTVNLNEPLLAKFKLMDREQLIDYESLPDICFFCGRYGHRGDLCHYKKSEERDLKVNGIKVSDHAVQNERNFGPWMVAPSRRRKNSYRKGDNGAKQGSRFAVLVGNDDEEDDDVENYNPNFLKAQGVNLGDSVENTLNPNQRSLARRVDTILDKQKHSIVLIESFGERERSAEDKGVIRNGEVESSYLPLGRPPDSSEEKGGMQSYSNSLFESFQGHELERNCRMGKEDDDENEDSASDEHKEESEEEFRDPYMRD